MSTEKSIPNSSNSYRANSLEQMRQASLHFHITIIKDLIVKTEPVFKHFKNSFAYGYIVSLILILVFLVFHQVTLINFPMISHFKWFHSLCYLCHREY